jgi:hypothetical protein
VTRTRQRSFALAFTLDVLLFHPDAAADEVTNLRNCTNSDLWV